MSNRSERDSDETGGVNKYLVALTPLFSRLALIAIITLSHSVSWLAPPSGSKLAGNKPIETALNEERKPITNTAGAGSMSAPHPSPRPARGTSQRNQMLNSTARVRPEAGIDGFLNSHGAPHFRTAPRSAYHYTLGGH